MNEAIRLTQYSHGAGCGCKIAPGVLQRIVGHESNLSMFPDLWVGHETKDDAAVMSLGDGTGVVSTTDFFMPIVDDPYTFGRIAATNALSDIYAMGGTPLMAIAILGWPVQTLAPEVAGQVINGGRAACREAGIPLAGGHSIDAPEPIFGLAVTGRVSETHLKRNQTARADDILCITKPIGIGILTTAMKKGLLSDEHNSEVTRTMCQLNHFGAQAAPIEGIHAMTDVTGFGLLGHLLEMCEGSTLDAEVNWADVPILSGVENYLAQGCSPGGAQRNFESYGHRIGDISTLQRSILCDPQTSGGLLLSIEPKAVEQTQELGRSHGVQVVPVGRFLPPKNTKARIEIH